eukprot:CAMPEP_0179978206 /NCGR_PEP_ID=MMETSP0983-20121128/40552_1 /TAXON_ID=483367 /ORGANISM="non described non described, Strain CCMP 2436" /LENGTH=40 /DNA_ID= /DNA_START= /DNA_END= /DNA_ORIENTATION=
MRASAMQLGYPTTYTVMRRNVDRVAAYCETPQWNLSSTKP